MSKTWEVKRCLAGGGFFATLQNERPEVVWCSLTTRSQEKAHQWMESARCHGTDAHFLTCKDCKTNVGRDDLNLV